MRLSQRSVFDPNLKRATDGMHSTGSELERKYWAALALYAGLAALVWFTMDAGKILVWGRPMELRLLPLIVIGGLALRTVLALQADKIRHGEDEERSSS